MTVHLRTHVFLEYVNSANEVEDFQLVVVLIEMN